MGGVAPMSLSGRVPPRALGMRSGECPVPDFGTADMRAFPNPPALPAFDLACSMTEAAEGHSPILSRPSTSRSISCDASLPDSRLPICSACIADGEHKVPDVEAAAKWFGLSLPDHWPFGPPFGCRPGGDRLPHRRCRTRGPRKVECRCTSHHDIDHD